MFLLLIAVVLILVIAKGITVLTNFQCTAHTCLTGKVAIVTGGNSGLGLETVFNLASRGCKVIIADVANGEESVAKVKEVTGNQNIIWKYLDLSSLTSVREFATGIIRTENRLDLLINNAGTAEYSGFTKDGLQKVMQINYFGHFLLTHLLVDLLKKTETSRVVSISSSLAFTNTLVTPKDINTKGEKNIMGTKVQFCYANSKVCVLIAMKLMAEKLKKYGVLCYSVHPGAIYTVIYKKGIQPAPLHSLIQNVYLLLVQCSIFILGKNIKEGIQTALHCALSKEVEGSSGKFFCNGMAFWEPAIANNKEFCLQMWEETEKLVKLTEVEKLH